MDILRDTNCKKKICPCKDTAFTVFLDKNPFKDKSLLHMLFVSQNQKAVQKQ